MTAPTRSRSAVLRIVLLDAAPPLVGYYGLLACGASEYVALLTATVLSGLKVTYDAVKARRLDPFACYLLLTSGLSLAARILLSAMWGPAFFSRSPCGWLSFPGYPSTSRTVCCPPSRWGRSAFSLSRLS